MDLKTLTDDELEQRRMDVLTEQERRARLANAPGQISQIATEFIADGGDLATLTGALSGTRA